MLGDSTLDPRTIEKDLETLLRRFFEAEIARGIVTLNVELSQGQPSGKSISVQPSRSGAAPLVAFCENGGEIIYLTLGQNTPMEVPVEGKRYTEFENAAELIALLKAVATGKFEETLWLKDSEIVRSTGRIIIQDGSVIKIKASRLSNPFVSLEKRVCRYLPYDF